MEEVAEAAAASAAAAGGSAAAAAALRRVQVRVFEDGADTVRDTLTALPQHSLIALQRTD